MKHLLVGLALAAPCVTALAATPPAMPAYHVAHTVTLGAPDRWDYLSFDPATQRLFVSHGDRVTVLDARDGSVLGQVEGFPGGTHGIGIVNALGRGYTDDGSAGTASSFDLKTFKPIRTIKADDDADAVTFDPPSGHIFVVNGDPGTLTVIDPKTDAAIATVSAGSKLEFAVSGLNGKLYVNAPGKGEIVRIDTHSNQADAHWPVPSCKNSAGLAIDTATHRLFSSCRNGVLVVVNADDGATVASLPIGRGTDAAAFDPKRHLIFSSNGTDGNISVIAEQDANTYSVLGSIPTAITARTMTIDPQSGRLYVAMADVDQAAQAAAAAAPVPRPRTPLVPGSLRVLFLDPTP
ncbi:MAG TPA: YncE family protein [Steroidobacteraceae bacterium]|nr:YncE family protein [Steroidobacteraceae bacterium]